MLRSAVAFRRELGLFDAAVVVAGGIVGVGIFANPSNVARVLHDPVQILLAWTIGGAVALVGGFVWAELASRFPQVGGQYVYLQRAYHPVVGFLYGIALLFIINGGSLTVASPQILSWNCGLNQSSGLVTVNGTAMGSPDAVADFIANLTRVGNFKNVNLVNLQELDSKYSFSITFEGNIVAQADSAS